LWEFFYSYGGSDRGGINEVPSGSNMLRLVYNLNVFTTLMLLGIPAIRGFVVVGQMLREYGNCMSLD
jgi:hypothetical protein